MRLLTKLLNSFGFVPKQDVTDVVEKYQNREIYASKPKPEPEPKLEDDDLGPINLNDIDPDELLNKYPFADLCEKIPEGWFMFEGGQSPLHMLWFCQLIDFNSMCSTNPDDQSAIDAVDVRRVYSEEKDTLGEALKDCLTKIESEEFL